MPSVSLGLLGEDRGCCRLRASTAAHQFHFIPDGDFTPFDHKTVECQLALEASVDAAGDLLVLDLRIGIIRSHDAAQA